MNSEAPASATGGERRIVIIGGGVAGLSAGIFARANGFETTILEKHTILGGECTGWERKGYHIDGCIHWLVGTKEGTPMNDLWKSVGALDGVPIHHPETFLTYEHETGTVPIYRDLDRLRDAWVKLSPQDQAAIEDFVSTILQLGAVEMEAAKPMDMMSLLEKARYMLSMKDAGAVLRRYGKVGLAEYAARFRHPAIRAMFATFAPGDYAVAFLFFGLATFAQGQSSIPIGGSKAIADRMAERYLALGGKVETGCEVIGIEMEGKRVGHLTTADGRTFTADHYIAACDAHVVFERLLGGRYRDPAFEKRFNDPETYPLASNTYVGLGLEAEAGDMPRTVRFDCEPIRLGGTDITQITLNHYAYEPGFAPPGCTAVTVALNHFGETIDHWFALAGDRAEYRREKERVGEAVREAIEAHFPRFAGKLTVLDVATPATYARYCNAYRGAFMGFFPTTRSRMMAHTGRIKGIDNFVLSGQWLQPPGGLPIAVVTGKDSIQRLCRMLKRPFVGEPAQKRAR
ncbi:MAG: phytoene desaturase family protein [Spirochaetota bacterium]